MRFRKLRIAFSVICGIACVLLILLWVRSHWRRDRLAGQLTSAHAFHVDSFVGRLAISWRVRPQGVTPVPTEFSTHSDPEGFWNRKDNILGFHIEGDSGTTSVTMPFWFLLVLTSSLCYISGLPRRFSLCTLLIAMTLVALLLGLSVYIFARTEATYESLGELNIIVYTIQAYRLCWSVVSIFDLRLISND